MAARSLLQALRTADDDDLAELLRTRPDLGVPAPADTAVLATRAGIRASVARACDDLDTFVLAVLDALVIAEADRSPVALPDVTRLLGPDVPAERLADALDALARRALIWDAGPPEADRVSLVPALRDCLPRYPAGLGRPSPALDGADIPALLAGVPADERRILDTLAAGPPIGRTRDADQVVPAADARTPIQRLLARRLLVRADAGTVELPAQVGLALRGRRPVGPVAVDPPAVPVTRRGQDAIDATGAGEVLQLIRRAELLIGSWSAESPGVLRSGGLGVRELRRAARELEVDERDTAVLIEVLVHLGLIATDEGVEPQWVPTTSADLWLRGSPEQRWVTLAAGWLDLPRLPGLIGRRDDRDRPLGLLTDDLRRPLAPRERRRVLAEVAALGPDVTIGDRAALRARLSWLAPRRGGRLRDDIVDWTLAEATSFGLLALDGLTTAGRVLLATPPDAGLAEPAAALAAVLPAPIDHVLVQADLTVLAPGRLLPDLADDLALVADVESSGTATVYRVTESTVRRALDSGRSADELHQLFGTRSRTPVPQSLTYLIDDVARRHGRLRGGGAGSYLRCDDPALLAQVGVHPAATALQLRRIASTVLVSPLPLARVLDGLREAGFVPVAEDAEGQLLDLRAGGRRIPSRPRPARAYSVPPVPDDEVVAALVRKLRAGDRAARIAPADGAVGGPRTSGETLALLQGAARERRSVWIGYVDARGVASRRIVEPMSVGGGILEGVDSEHGALRRFALHRITSAALITPER